MQNPLINFPTEKFKLAKNPPKNGSLLFKPNDHSITREEVFEVLKQLYGEPNQEQGGVWVDRKVSWTWIFETSNGFFSCYDFKGWWSIGHRGEKNEALEKDAKEFLQELEKVILEYRKYKNREPENTEEALEMFMYSLAATFQLINIARTKKAPIEELILTCTAIDGLLRISIILKQQLNNKNSDIEERLIYQKKSDRGFLEKAIFKRAKDLKLITEEQESELVRLYNKRNQIIHRFCINKVEYQELGKTIIEYRSIMDQIKDIPVVLEKEQVEKGIGMTTSESIKTSSEEELSENISKGVSNKLNSRRPFMNPPEKMYMFAPDEEDEDPIFSEEFQKILSKHMDEQKSKKD